MEISYRDLFSSIDNDLDPIYTLHGRWVRTEKFGAQDVFFIGKYHGHCLVYCGARYELLPDDTVFTEPRTLPSQTANLDVVKLASALDRGNAPYSLEAVCIYFLAELAQDEVVRLRRSAREKLVEVSHSLIDTLADRKYTDAESMDKMFKLFTAAMQLNDALRDARLRLEAWRTAFGRVGKQPILPDLHRLLAGGADSGGDHEA